MYMYICIQYIYIYDCISCKHVCIIAITSISMNHICEKCTHMKHIPTYSRWIFGCSFLGSQLHQDISGCNSLLSIQWAKKEATGNVPYKAILWGYIPLHSHSPYIGQMYGRYLQSMYLKWPLIHRHGQRRAKAGYFKISVPFSMLTFCETNGCSSRKKPMDPTPNLAHFYHLAKDT